MDADLDSLLAVVFCTADDLLPTQPGNARRMVTDAEVVTLAVAQVLLGYHDSDRRFLAAAERRLVHLFPQIPTQDAFHKRRARLEASIEWLIGVFAAQSPGYHDDMLVWISPRCRPLARARQSSAPATASWRTRSGTPPATATAPRIRGSFTGCGCICSPPWTAPRAPRPCGPPSAGEREVAIGLLTRGLHGGETVIADKGYAGEEFPSRRGRARRHDHPTEPQDRTQTGTSHLRRPPTRRIDHPDHQRHTRTRTPRRPHPAQPPRPHLRPTARTRRLHHPQPQPRPPQPPPHPIHHLTVASLSRC